MNKKNILWLIILTAMFFTVTEKTFASPAIPQKEAAEEINLDANEGIYSENEIIKRVSLKNKFQKSPEAQISSFIKKYNNYAESNNFKKLKELYTENYVNNDGFNLDTMFKMMQMASNSYKKVKYTTVIDKIEVNGKYAIVKAHETATAQTNTLSSKIPDEGSVVSEIDYVDHLVKDGNNWKISASEILREEVSMKYGEAKKMDIEITAPACTAAGSQYEVSINANTPDGVFALGSIVNEPIVFPQTENKDVFRAIKSEKLARVLTANKDNHNEYVTVSIALTRAEVEPPAVNINMTGMAFAMKRINVLHYSNKEELNGTTK